MNPIRAHPKIEWEEKNKTISSEASPSWPNLEMPKVRKMLHIGTGGGKKSKASSGESKKRILLT